MPHIYILDRGIAVEWTLFLQHPTVRSCTVDGIGGQVKREARLAALSGKTVHYVAEFINVQSSQCVIKLFEITEN